MTEGYSGYPREYAYARGKYVYFRYFTEEDARGNWHLWFNSPKITKYLLARKWLNKPEDQLKYFEYVRTTKDRLAVAVVDVKTDKLIGVCSIGSIDFINRHAEMSSIIGEEEFHKGSHALEAVAMITEIGFTRLNMHKLIGVGLEGNRNALEISKLLGYKESGRFKEHGFVEDHYEDAIILEIFQRDWLPSKKRPKI